MGFDPTMGSELSRPDHQAMWAVAGGAMAAGAGAGAGAAGEQHPGYGRQAESGDGGGGAASAAFDQGAVLGGDACGDPGAGGATDLGWLSAEQLAEMGLARKEDVVKSTSMVRRFAVTWCRM